MLYRSTHFSYIVQHFKLLAIENYAHREQNTIPVKAGVHAAYTVKMTHTL